ncbi:unnamed protein product [Adineta ricciae]|uniref:G-protein coupled receptors family 1 profile domain-containing protein n=1 Tax=Adineta ricciae TaxID=249248 RepID=A0A814ZD63_ADIRI|nr:unnamed protein product [Adineta ricciae]CAF1241281.1 unnamed protein product [Adineta ricciae]
MTTTETLCFVSQQLNIYWDLSMFILGIIGAIWIILAFHHHTLRSSSYWTYLRFAAVASLIQILFSLSDRIIYAGFDIHWTATNVAWCKIHYFAAHCTSLNALSFLVYSAIDRFFSTCASTAKRACTFTIVFWTILTIPTLVYAKPVQIKLNGYSCENTFQIWSQIVVFFFSLCCYGIFPWLFMSLFGFLTWKNLRRIHHRRICITSSVILTHKARIDDDLTSMLFLQISSCILSSIPFCSQNIYSIVTQTMNKTELRQAQEYLYLRIARLAFYFNYISTFYINYLSSAIFRQVSRQVLRNLFKNKENLSRQATMVNHQEPKTQ